MAEKLFRLLRAERDRLDRAIAQAEADSEMSLAEIHRLKALHEAVNEQIGSWMRDLYGSTLTGREWPA